MSNSITAVQFISTEADEEWAVSLVLKMCKLQKSINYNSLLNPACV
jgi:hypothetical protein